MGVRKELAGSKYSLIGWDEEIHREILEQIKLDFILVSNPEQKRIISEIKPCVEAEIILFDPLHGCLIEQQKLEHIEASLVSQLDKIRSAKILGALPLTIRGDELYYELARKTYFSEKEYQILHYLSYGYTYPEVAEATHLSLNTVTSYIKELRQKLNARDKSHLLAIAFRSGLVV